VEPQAGACRALLPLSMAPNPRPSLEAAVRGADVIVTRDQCARADPPGRVAEARRACQCRRLAAAPIGASSTMRRCGIRWSSNSREAVLKESGDCDPQRRADLPPEIGEIFAGLKPAPRDATTIFQIGRPSDRGCRGRPARLRRPPATNHHNEPRSLQRKITGRPLVSLGNCGEVGPGFSREADEATASVSSVFPW